MAAPARPPRPPGTRRAFDLRATALFFALAALLVVLAGSLARAAAGVLERRPVWAVAVGCAAAAGALALRRRRRRSFSPAHAAREAVEALDEAARTALDELDSPPPAPAAAWAPAGRERAGTEPTLLLEPGEPGGSGAPGAAADGPGTGYEALEPEEFEQAVAALCARDGCSDVAVVGGAGDLGADVVATAPDGRRVVLQCKRYDPAHRVGSQDLQRFGGTCFTVHEADLAVLVTTSEPTAPAAEYAEQCGIVCVDGRALRAWSDGTGPAPWEIRPPGPVPR
ncbi:restriction endonuclease [Streptomyces echinoruber]|uniref:Restriction endonuclease n=1 Tax=Streptomyces echinoruber TaxID=68898 RepID=A0A918VGZ5_9ACTN|nr:restriction endonuclease [Streptomyces echinoruber]GGZ98127.1 restriction endonuclease [Streptomyces echinoruber]